MNMKNIFSMFKHQYLRLPLFAMMIASGTAAFAQDEAEEQAPERKPVKATKVVKQYPTVTLLL